jgi:hypothetical protein
MLYRVQFTDDAGDPLTLSGRGGQAGVVRLSRAEGLLQGGGSGISASSLAITPMRSSGAEVRADAARDTVIRAHLPADALLVFLSDTHIGGRQAQTFSSPLWSSRGCWRT